MVKRGFKFYVWWTIFILWIACLACFVGFLIHGASQGENLLSVGEALEKKSGPIFTYLVAAASCLVGAIVFTVILRRWSYTYKCCLFGEEI